MITGKALAEGGDYWTIRRDLYKLIGRDEVLVLTELIWLRQKSGTTNPGYFVEATNEHFSDVFGMSPYYTRNALTRLESFGLIRCEVFGLPAKRHAMIIDKNLEGVMSGKAIGIDGQWWPPGEETEMEMKVEVNEEDDISSGINIMSMVDRLEKSKGVSLSVFQAIAKLNPDYIWTADDGKALGRVRHKIKERIKAKKKELGFPEYVTEKEIIKIVRGMIENLPEFYLDLIPYDFKILDSKFNVIAKHYSDIISR